MAGEEKYLNKDLAEVLREMSKAPGGNVAQPRPRVPGPILGGPPPETPRLGKVDPLTGVRTKRDPAIELFRFYAYGEEKTSRIPEPSPDVKTVTVSSLDIDSEEKMIREAKKEAGLPVKRTENRRRINQAVREGTIGGMSRPPGSKPPVHLAKNLPIALEVAAERARRMAEADIIRDALEKAFTADYTDRILSREEQKYRDLLQRRIQDIIANREAAVAEELARRGQTTPTLEQVKATREAERRTLEGRQVAERNRVSRAKTEASMKMPIVGKGLAAFGAVGLGLEAVSLYKQMIEQASARKAEIQSNLEN